MNQDSHGIPSTVEADTLLIKQHSGIPLEEIESTELREAVASAYVRNLDWVMDFILMIKPIAAERGESCDTLNEALTLYHRLADERKRAGRS